MLKFVLPIGSTNPKKSDKSKYSRVIRSFHIQGVCIKQKPGFFDRQIFRFQIFGLTIPNNKKDALVNVKFDNLPVVKNQKLKKGIKALGILFHLRPTAAF